ncbi:hypothetical protein HDU98_008014 [Podochytrium sp. JEL0797]|nr:hypothetical protein HDU98_008014 [Podochytrium sp. JEL0797]
MHTNSNHSNFKTEIRMSQDTDEHDSIYKDYEPTTPLTMMQSLFDRLHLHKSPHHQHDQSLLQHSTASRRSSFTEFFDKLELRNGLVNDTASVDVAHAGLGKNESALAGVSGPCGSNADVAQGSRAGRFGGREEGRRGAPARQTTMEKDKLSLYSADYTDSLSDPSLSSTTPINLLVKSLIERIKRTASKATPLGPGRSLPVASFLDKFELKNGLVNVEPPSRLSRGNGKREATKILGIELRNDLVFDGRIPAETHGCSGPAKDGLVNLLVYHDEAEERGNGKKSASLVFE